MKLTKAGFPAEIKSLNHLLHELKKRKAHQTAVPTHYNSETGVSYLHNGMYALEREGLVNIVRKNSDEFQLNDILFCIEINFTGLSYLEEKRGRRFNYIINIVIVILTLIGVACGIISII